MRAFGALLLLCLSAVAAVGRKHHLQHDPEGYAYHEHSLAHPYMANGMEIPYWGEAWEKGGGRGEG